MGSSVMISSSLPAPIDITHHLSEPTKRHAASTVKRFYKYFQIPGIGQLAGGRLMRSKEMPFLQLTVSLNDQRRQSPRRTPRWVFWDKIPLLTLSGLPYHNYFPFDTLEASTAKPDRWRPTPNDPVKPPTTNRSRNIAGPLNPKASHITVPRETDEQNLLRKIDVKTALQYGQAAGYPPLGAWVKSFATNHMFPNQLYAGGLDTTLTCGNTDGISKSMEALSNIWNEGIHPIERREGVLCEEFSFMGGVEIARARGLNIVPVKMDPEGMLADGKGGLEDVLKNWDDNRGRRPHLMYTISLGQNPTGAVLGVKRRDEIYEVCVKYDVMIIEDQPYWYLQYPKATQGEGHLPQKGKKSSGFEFLDSLIPSFIDNDYQGRVVRCDTFSKTVAPGCRLGWITAQPALTERIQRIAETSTAAPSGFGQSMIAELLMGPQGGKQAASHQDGWDVTGWVRWLEGLRGNYERRMTTMCDILDKGTHLVKSGRRPSLSQVTLSDADNDNDDWGVIESTQIYQFVRPVGGMFTWVTMNYETHPLANDFPLVKLAAALWVFLTTKPYLVLVAPGQMFCPTPERVAAGGYRGFRLCFAADEEELIARSTTGFIQGVAAYWRIKDREQIQKLLDEMEAEGLDAMDQRAWASPHMC